MAPGRGPHGHPHIDASAVRAAYRRALRTGMLWRLRPDERAILSLSSRLRRVRSPVLREILKRIICRILPGLARRLEAMRLGAQLVEMRVRQALKLGYRRALSWLGDAELALQAGYALLNTPRIYWPAGIS